MTFDRFSKLFDALVTNRPNAPKYIQVGNDATHAALVAYANGDKSLVNAARAFLGHDWK